LVSAALQGYLIGLGDLGRGALSWVVRSFIGLAGITLALPAGGLFGISQLILLAIAGGALALGLGLRKLNSAMLNTQAL
jgi:hypothetical protein